MISSDNSQEDYQKLIKKYEIKTDQLVRKVEFLMDKSDDDTKTDIDPDSDNFMRLALSFNSKQIKERLFQQLHIVGIPWFSLINAKNGDILCENLKIFILNSQLREMVF